MLWQPTSWAADQPSIEEYATVEAYIKDVPVYAFGYTYVYGVSPDLMPGAVFQEANTNLIVKIAPKKSWEIKHSLFGTTPAREPKTMWNDDQPLLPLHLIDGDPETAWSSRGGNAADANPEWIRIDLPAETPVASVVLVCSRIGPSGFGRVGKVLPKKLTIRLSRDAQQWNTVYTNENFTGPDTGPSVINFDPQSAKQIWIIAGNLQQVGNWGKGLSIGEVEVRDPAGNNLALVSRGAGVQVSSTYYGYGMDRFTQDMLWPIQYDLGVKWLRVGYDMGMYLWSYVEREKGKLEIDRRADEVITEAVRNGVNVIMCLDKGNWLYRNPPRKVEWKKARTREMMETYYDHQGWPTDNPEMLAGYLRYVDYMVRHFKGRVAYFEICNEWQAGSAIGGVSNYVELVKATIPVIKKADPNARIMLGSVGGFDQGAILGCLGDGSEIKNGNFVTLGRTIAVADGVREKDVTVSVNARSDAEAGIMLRFKDDKNFLLANYAPQNNGMYFHEVVDGNYGQFLARKELEGFGPNIRLTAGVEGVKATLSVSDGNKSLTTSYSIQRLQDAGGVGLFHNLGARQTFANFHVAAPDGRTILSEQFNRAGGKLSGWKLVEGSWMNASAKIVAAQLDAIGWHPFYQADPGDRSRSIFADYRKSLEQFKKECNILGFKGQYAATEWTWAAPYPPATSGLVVSEIQKAKYSAQLMIAHSGMDVISLYNETFQSGRLDWDCNLLRNAFQSDPISSTQPQPIYYVFRNLFTALDDFRAVNFPVRFGSQKVYECYTFKRGTESLVAAWIPGRTGDGIVEEKTEVTLPRLECKRAWVIDTMNGTEQELNITHRDNDTVIEGVLIKDYPVFVRIAK